MEIKQKTVVPEYKWAGEVKERYKYTCIFCGKQQTGRLMHAHHVVQSIQIQHLLMCWKTGLRCVIGVIGMEYMMVMGKSELEDLRIRLLQLSRQLRTMK